LSCWAHRKSGARLRRSARFISPAVLSSRRYRRAVIVALLSSRR
jgi:hypothetical protein